MTFEECMKVFIFLWDSKHWQFGNAIAFAFAFAQRKKKNTYCIHSETTVLEWVAFIIATNKSPKPKKWFIIDSKSSIIIALVCFFPIGFMWDVAPVSLDSRLRIDIRLNLVKPPSSSQLFGLSILGNRSKISSRPVFICNNGVEIMLWNLFTYLTRLRSIYCATSHIPQEMWI